MNRNSIDYYFSVTSPWAYLGHEILMKMVARHGVAINYHPIALGRVFPETGGLPLAKRHPARQAYRFLELQRWRQKRGIAFKLRPKFFPMDTALADKCVIALRDARGDVAGFMTEIFHAVFALDQNGADEAVLASLLTKIGADAVTLIAHAKSEATSKLYTDESEAAVAAGVFGSPAYVRDGEIFWGQDRLELLEDAIISARAGFRSDHRDD